LTHAYVRLHNGPDARVANPALGNIYGNVDGANNIFNNGLYGTPPGGGGIFVTNNGAFFTRFSPAGLAEANAYITYTTHSASGWTVDPNGHRPALDPACGLEFPPHIRRHFALEYSFNPYRFSPYWPPNRNGSIHIGAGHNQLATYQDLLNIRGYVAYCESRMYGQPGLNPACSAGVATWQSNYDNSNGSGTPLPVGLPGVTNLEAFKGEVEAGWIAATHSGNFSNYSFSTNGAEFGNPSGSKVYSRNVAGYANPTNSATIAFGTPGTPYALLLQLAQNGSVCVNPDDPAQWNNPNTMLGKLLARCKQIVPSADWLTVRGLLNVYTINLGDYQYIYSPDGISLTVTTTPPAFLGPLPEHAQPGITQPDGTLMPNCKDADFTGSIGNQINAEIGNFGNIKGDIGLHQVPFQNASGFVDSYDFANWQSSSGKDDLLGQLSFYNQVSANAQFSSPN
jgi:hypothetical protein